MELNIKIEEVEQDLYEGGHELYEINEAVKEAEKTMLAYSKIGLLPRIGEVICSTTFDHGFEITEIAYCEDKIMMFCKLEIGRAHV